MGYQINKEDEKNMMVCPNFHLTIFNIFLGKPQKKFSLTGRPLRPLLPPPLSLLAISSFLRLKIAENGFRQLFFPIGWDQNIKKSFKNLLYSFVARAFRPLSPLPLLVTRQVLFGNGEPAWMADYTLLKNPRALSTVEQLTISMFVYTCACRCFNSDTYRESSRIFYPSVVRHSGRMSFTVDLVFF